MKKSTRIIVWTAIAVVLAFFLLRYLLIGVRSVPVDFASAREQSVNLAYEITALSNESLIGLSKIAEYDEAWNFSEALILVSGELIRTNELNQKAVALSGELGKMAQELGRITPSRGREMATEAISYEVAMVSRLIGYNASLRELFELLRGKFTGRVVDADGKVKKLLEDINAGATAVNELNKAFNESLVKFDEVYR